MADAPTRRRRLRRRVSERLPEHSLPPRAELMEQAAERSRAGIRSRRERLVETARPILHTAVAAAGAWFVAHELIGHKAPFFAPTAAVITLGLTVGQRRRRAFEIGLGVAVGIFVGDLIVALIGTGTWQIAVLTGLAMVVATALGGGPLVASQAAVSAVLVGTIQPPTDGLSFARFIDASVGSAVALLVSSLLFPVDPVGLARAGTEPLLDRLAAVLDQIAEALEERHLESAERALVATGEIEPEHNRLEASLEAALDTARLAPGRRAARVRLRRYSRVAHEIGLAPANVRVLARGASRAITLEDSTPAELHTAVHELAATFRELVPYLEGEDPEPVREHALRAAGLANAVLEETANLSALHLVGQVRLIAVDTLRATGLSREHALAAVRSA
jgi:Fusaric acid resistance protein-like